VGGSFVQEKVSGQEHGNFGKGAVLAMGGSFGREFLEIFSVK
jgi:hypothetical protein